MSFAERIYQVLVQLYPAKHRSEFGEAMLTHARDLQRDAWLSGRWSTARLYASLMKDGLVNACKEHWEGSMMSNNGMKPAPWMAVLLAVIPGLLIILTRRISPQLMEAGAVAWYLYLGGLAIAVLVTWWRKRSIPAWALLPLGALIWVLIYAAGQQLSGPFNFFQNSEFSWPGMQAWIGILQVLVITAVCAITLRGQRLPWAAWVILGVMLAGNLVLAILYSLAELGPGKLLPGVVQYFTRSGVGPLEGLMLAAVGLLFAREHGVLAILVAVGGYGYMLTDSDYLFGYPQRDWTWMTTYFAALTVLYLVVIPVALLRARTYLGSLLAVFIPLAAFHVLRLIVPVLVIQQPPLMLPGDVVLSINILLSFMLAWVVYDRLGEGTQAKRANEDLAVDPLVN